MGRKRGELPTPAEATVEMGLKYGWVCVDIEYRYCKNKYRKNGKIKNTYVKLYNTKTQERTNWMQKQTARKRYGTQNKERLSSNIGHTDETVAKQVEKLTNGNAELVSWGYNEENKVNIKAKVVYNCSCEIEKRLATLTPDCPNCSAKWRTEAEVCDLVEQLANKMDDDEISVTAHRQETVHMNINGERVSRRFDCVVKVAHKKDPSIAHWVAIEYQGEAHYKPINFGNLSEEELMQQFKEYQQRDAHKRKFCEHLNIPLIEIPYWKKGEIHEIVSTEVRDAIWGRAFWCAGRYAQLHPYGK